MVWTWTHGIDYTHGIDLDLWYGIRTPESHTYKRAVYFPYAGFKKYIFWHTGGGEHCIKIACPFL